MLVPFRCAEDDMLWAGLSCPADEPCPIYLELTAVETAGNKLFTAGNIHSQTVTLYSVLLGSDDSGLNWREIHPRIRGAGLDRIQFTDLANGWVSGEALSPLPQDPFLLLTSDGGSTWRQRPLFAETRVGQIRQIRFTSKNEGSLVFDRGPGTGEERYELYESHDAGESWNIVRANNQPIRLENPAQSAATWRLQPEAKSQSFLLEHEEAGRWSAAASFAVDLGVCKSQPGPQ
jgi:photosystem II stability/assembly factor-like uncharacterized protein